MMIVDTERRTRLVCDIAIITLLVDKGLLTVEEAAQRIELIQSLMPETFRSDPVTAQLGAITSYLRSHALKLPVQWKPEVIQGGKPDDEQ